MIMETVDFLETSNWILEQFKEVDLDTFLQALQSLSHAGGGALSPDVIEAVMRTSHQLPLMRERIIAHPHAPGVLKAFELDEFLREDFPLQIAIAVAGSRERGEDRVFAIATKLWRRLLILRGCIQPVGDLLVPPQVFKEVDYDEVLTLRLQTPQDSMPTTDFVRAVLRNVTELYAAIAILEGKHEFPPLRILYINSGSMIRIDLKGLGEPIKHIKELLIEGWGLLRHRKADDVRHNNIAILQSLATVQQITGMRERGELPPEDATRLSQQVLQSASALLEAGVLPREVKNTEVIDNEKLLDEFRQKLLPPAPSDMPSKRKSRKRATKKRKSSDDLDPN
jgi:hypothetical protein